jgi:hypothetical protein
MNATQYAKQYDQAGFKLCVIHPGTKAPQYPSWEQNPIAPHRIPANRGLGLLHVQSRTVAIDLDDLEQASHWFDAQGIDLRALLDDDDAVQVVSGKPNRAKLIYRLSKECAPLCTKKVKDGSGRMLIELRCASSTGSSLQDVLPPTIHPETKQPYAWGGAGSFDCLPELPLQLLELWRELTDYPPEHAATTPPKLELMGCIPEGGRNDWLYKRAGDMVRQGMPTNALIEALQALNEQRCEPPLERREVDLIARSAMTTSHGARELAQNIGIGSVPLAGGARSSNLSTVNVAEIFISPSPPPDFIWEGLVPRGVVTLMGAHGGTGKSMMALMLAVSVALGRQLWGCPTKQVKALFLSLEDGPSVVRHRLANICRIWSIDPAELHGHLHIVDGTEFPELFVAEGRGEGNLTPSYDEMVEMIEAEDIGFLIVDNASDAFGADEIQRRHVRSFIRSLNHAIRQTNAGCLLLAHVDKNTSRNQKAEGGESYSGSTAWHNSARSRLFLVRENSGLLKLEHKKSNFGKKLEPIILAWPEHGLPELAGSGEDVDGLLTQHQGRQDDEKAGKLLVLIAEYEGRGQYMACGTTSRNNPYAILYSDPQFKRLKLNREDVKRLITQCQRAKWIDRLEYKTPDRKPHLRWTLTNEGRLFAGLGAPTAPTSEDGA